MALQFHYLCYKSKNQVFSIKRWKNSENLYKSIDAFQKDNNIDSVYTIHQNETKQFIDEREDNCPPGYICTIASGNLLTFKSRLEINDYICISKFSVLTGQYVGYKQYIACEQGYMTLHNDSDGVPYGQCRIIHTDGIK